MTRALHAGACAVSINRAARAPSIYIYIYKQVSRQGEFEICGSAGDVQSTREPTHPSRFLFPGKVDENPQVSLHGSPRSQLAETSSQKGLSQRTEMELQKLTLLSGPCCCCSVLIITHELRFATRTSQSSQDLVFRDDFLEA